MKDLADRIACHAKAQAILVPGRRYEFFQRLAPEVPAGMDWAEFGVHTGNTANILLDLLPSDQELFLFDSFQGLPSDWRPNFPAGTFALDVPPVFEDPRVTVIKGWFSQTVATWARSRTDPLGLIHVDCDIYESAKVVLEATLPLVVPGSIIVFDEFYGYEGYENHEIKAYIETVMDSIPHRFSYRSGIERISVTIV